MIKFGSLALIVILLYLVCSTSNSATFIPRNLVNAQSNNGDFCEGVQGLNRCGGDEQQDLLLVLDASSSIDINDFTGTMLEVARRMICAYPEDKMYRIGLMTFGTRVSIDIPMDNYSREEWSQRIDALVADPPCCSCCTPTAEAFVVAKEELEQRSDAEFRSVFVITDGFPVPNQLRPRDRNDPYFLFRQNRPQASLLPGFPQTLPLQWRGGWTWPQYGPNNNRLERLIYADYMYDIVPRRARALKDETGALICMVGVPNSQLRGGVPPDMAYFRGIPIEERRPRNTPQDNPDCSTQPASFSCPNPDTCQCVERRGSYSAGNCNCRSMSSEIFPIVSEPADFFSFSVEEFNLDELMRLSIERCACSFDEIPTPSPIFTPPTPPESPTIPPTNPPVGPPTPTTPPTDPPVGPPTPTTPPTDPPVGPPTPTTPPTDPPVGPPTPTTPPTDPPVGPPTPPTIATPQPTDGPIIIVEGELQYDMIFLLDQSRSMRWFGDALCSRVANQESLQFVRPNRSASTCWELQVLLMQEVISTLFSTANSLPGTRLQWFDDVVDADDDSEGLRVFVYSFACTDNQQEPIVNVLTEPITNQADFDAFIQVIQNPQGPREGDPNIDQLPDGGTCPGLALETILSELAETNEIEQSARPRKAVLTMTDGLFYDQPQPLRNANGFPYFGIPSYTAVIGKPFVRLRPNGRVQYQFRSNFFFGNRDFPVNPFDLERQDNQIQAITRLLPNEGGNPSNENSFIFGLNTIAEISESISEDLVNNLNNFWDQVLLPGSGQQWPPLTYCGWASEICETKYGDDCVWYPNPDSGNIYDKGMCCIRDSSQPTQGLFGAPRQSNYCPST